MKQNKLAGLVSLSLIVPVETDAEGMPVAEMNYYNALYSQIQSTNMPGVSHDGENQFFVEIADGWENEQYLNLNDLVANTPADTAPEDLYTLLEMTIGSILVDDKPIIIVGDFVYFKTLFSRPLWQLWCGSFSDELALEAAYQAFFNTTDTLDKRKSYDNLVLDVRTKIRDLINGINSNS